MKNTSVLVVVGRTASGKSALAVKLAKKFNGEIISADSRQVYKKLDIGTGKITQREMKGIPHHLLDIVNPKNTFSVADFKILAETKIKQIIERGHLPILCGGTGFYVDAIIKGIILPQVAPNNPLRKKLSLKSATENFEYLKKIDPIRAKNIDPHNNARIIRAIEIAKALGKVPKIKSRKLPYKFIKIGILPTMDYRKVVETRVKNMFKKGLLKEIENLKKSGISQKRLTEFGFEYNKPTLEKVVSGTLKYAKRQDTWWKRDNEINWFKPNSKKEIEEFIQRSL